MKHQPAGSGDGCAVYTMRQWVQASGNRPGLAPERERQELRPAQLTPGDKWLLGFLCTGMFWRKGYSTEYSGSAPLTFFRGPLLKDSPSSCVSPKVCSLQYLHSPAAYTYVLKYFHSSAVSRDSYLKSP